MLNKRIKRIFALIKKEFLSILKNPKSRALVILPPIMQLFVFAPAITFEVKNIELSILDYSNSYYSRELASRFYNSSWFHKIYFEKDLNSLKNHINLKKTHCALVIQNDFEKNINSNKPADVLAILDGRQTNSASIILGYISQIVNDYNYELKQKRGIKEGKIDIVTRNWYNPNIEYQWFLTVNLIVVLSLVLSLLLSALTIAQERELGTFNQLMVTPLDSDEILIGKVIVPLILSFTSTIIITLMVVYIFKIHFAGSIILYLISIIISLLSLIGIGLFISSLSDTQQKAILGVFAFETPAVLLSGFVSPVEDMPVFFQYLSMLNPLRYYMLIVRGIYFKNMDIQTIALNLIPLIIIAFVTLNIAKISFKKATQN